MNDTISTTELSEFALRDKKTVGAIVEHFANQYYVYGPVRSGFSSYARDLRRAMADDVRLGCKYWHTLRELENIYELCTEESAYVVGESKELVCNLIRNMHDKAQAENFKNTLAGKPKVTDW